MEFCERISKTGNFQYTNKPSGYMQSRLLEIFQFHMSHDMSVSARFSWDCRSTSSSILAAPPSTRTLNDWYIEYNVYFRTRFRIRSPQKPLLCQASPHRQRLSITNIQYIYFLSPMTYLPSNYPTSPLFSLLSIHRELVLLKWNHLMFAWPC